MKLKKILTAVASLAVVMAIGVTSINVTSIPTFAASSMKVENYEGKVALKNVKGKAKTLRAGVSLLTGDNLTTQSQSSANILLDKTKDVLVEESSAVTVKKSGSDLDLIVDKGSVFFDVSKKLTSKESFEIKTSNMVCGIRGTVGEVKTVVDKKKKTTKTYVYLLEGSVKVTYNATKKKKKTQTIKAGQKLTVSTNTSTGKSTTSVAKIKSADIKKSVAETIKADSKLKARVEKGVTSLNWTKTLKDAIAGKNDSKDNSTTSSEIGPKISGSLAKKDIKVVYDCIYFGNYWQEDTNGDGKADKNDDKQPIMWRILSQNGNDAFIVADKVLDAQQYNTEKVDTTWETSYMRSWMNDVFLNNAFSKSEQDAIITTKVKTKNTYHYNTPGGNDTLDKVFLLSVDDIRNTKYGFCSSDYEEHSYIDEKNQVYDYAIRKIGTPFARAYGFETEYGHAATGTGYFVYGEDEYREWCLRSTGQYATKVAVNYTNGWCDWFGRKVEDPSFGVCPAMHIDLSKANYKKAGTVTCGPTVKNGIEYKE